MQSPRKPSQAAASAGADDGGDDNGNDAGNDAAGPIRRNVSFAGADVDVDADEGVGGGEPEATTPTHGRAGLSRQLTFKEKRSIMEQVTPVIEAIEKRLVRQITQTAHEQRKLESESKLGFSQLQATARAAQPPRPCTTHVHTHTCTHTHKHTHTHTHTHAAHTLHCLSAAWLRTPTGVPPLCDGSASRECCRRAGAVAVGHT